MPQLRGRVEYMNAFCPNCGVIEKTVAQQIGGKIAFGTISYTFGKTALKKDPALAILATILGLAIGHYIDQELSKKCPQCGALLRQAGLLP
jgi:ribosomal protein S27AE